MNQFWRLNRVMAETGLSRPTLYRKMSEGTFPQNFNLTERSVAWDQREVEEWKANQRQRGTKAAA